MHLDWDRLENLELVDLEETASRLSTTSEDRRRIAGWLSHTETDTLERLADPRISFLIAESIARTDHGFEVANWFSDPAEPGQVLARRFLNNRAFSGLAARFDRTQATGLLAERLLQTPNGIDFVATVVKSAHVQSVAGIVKSDEFLQLTRRVSANSSDLVDNIVASVGSIPGLAGPEALSYIVGPAIYELANRPEMLRSAAGLALTSPAGPLLAEQLVRSEPGRKILSFLRDDSVCLSHVEAISSTDDGADLAAALQRELAETTLAIWEADQPFHYISAGVLLAVVIAIAASLEAAGLIAAAAAIVVAAAIIERPKPPITRDSARAAEARDVDGSPASSGAFPENASMFDIVETLRARPLTEESKPLLVRALEPFVGYAQALVDSGAFDDDPGLLERVEDALRGLRVQMYPRDGESFKSPHRAFDYAAELASYCVRHYRSADPTDAEALQLDAAAQLLEHMAFTGTEADTAAALDLGEAVTHVVDWDKEPDWLVDQDAFDDYIETRLLAPRALEAQVHAQNLVVDGAEAATALYADAKQAWLEYAQWARTRSAEAIAVGIGWIKQEHPTAKRVASFLPPTAAGMALGTGAGAGASFAVGATQTQITAAGSILGAVFGLALAILGTSFMPDKKTNDEPNEQQ